MRNNQYLTTQDIEFLLAIEQGYDTANEISSFYKTLRGCAVNKLKQLRDSGFVIAKGDREYYYKLSPRGKEELRNIFSFIENERDTKS